jgi:hypothetical protein
MHNMLSRQKFSYYTHPTIETVLEILLMIAQKKLKLPLDQIYVFEEITMNASGTISFA